jgi:hypothetical protein
MDNKKQKAPPILPKGEGNEGDFSWIIEVVVIFAID